MVFIDMIAAMLMGVLSGMGVGGGGLLVIYLTLIKGVGQIEAQGLNLYFFLFASAASLFVHCRKRRINYPLVLLMGLLGMPAAYVGSCVATVTDPHIVRILFGSMLVLAGGITLVRGIFGAIRNKNARKK